MWWSEATSRAPRRRAALSLPLSLLLLLAVSLLPGACGFRPLYGGGEAGTGPVDELAAIRIAPLEDRIGQQFHNLLRDRLNPRGQPAEPAYLFNVRLTRTSTEVAIRRDETATRADLTLRASFELRDWRTDTLLLLGRSNTINSYNLLESQFATSVAEQDAVERGLRELSEDIRLQLAAYFSRLRNAEAEE